MNRVPDLHHGHLWRRLVMPWQFWMASGITMAIAGLVIYQSINRPYDIVPDQDLLWLSEALRLYRGAPTTYIDHPGALWTLVDLFNLHFSQRLGLIHYTIGQGINIADADTIVRIARAENILVSSLTLISLWPIARWIGLDRNRSMIWIILLSTSTGFLWSLVQIRHEMASILFASLFLSLCHCSQQLGSSKKYWMSLAAWILAIASLMLAMYCKIQIILIFPIIITSLIAIQPDTLRKVMQQSPVRLIRSNLVESSVATVSLAATIALVTRYTSEQGYPLDPRSIGFWIILNLTLSTVGLTFASYPNQGKRKNPRAIVQTIRNCILIISPVTLQLSFAAILFRGSWTAGWSGTVFRAPTEIFGGRGLYYSGGNEAVKNGLRIESVAQSLSLRLQETFALPSSITLLLFSIIIATIMIYFFLEYQQLQSTQGLHQRHQREPSLGILLTLLAVAGSILANSARNQNFYAIYIAIPSIFIALFLVSWQIKMLSLQRIIRAASLLLILAAALRSSSNIFELSPFTAFDHHGTLCYGQQMDIEMRQTSIGQCRNFKLEMKR